MLNVVGFPTFWQTLHLPSSGLMCTGHFRKPYLDQAVGSESDVKDVIGRTEEQAAVKSVAHTWLRKGSDEKRFKSHVVRRRGD
jgi:hypothetical protein